MSAGDPGVAHEPAREAAGLFTRTTLWAVIGVAGLSLIAAAVLTVFGEELSEGAPSPGADTYSQSAIGHRGLVELLDGMRIPVVRSRDDSAGKARNGLLVIAEPSVADAASRARLLALVEASPRTLIVLPKWYGSAAQGEAWVRAVDGILATEVEQALLALELEEPRVVRKPFAVPLAWTADADAEAGAGAGAGAGMSAVPVPALREPQLFTSTDLTPLLTARDGTDGILLGSALRGTSQVWVLADPDALNNHGLRAPINAQFAVELIDRLREGGPVVFDEILHGYGEAPSLVRALFRFPIVLATLQVLICAVLVIWAAMVRFGPRRAAPPPLAPGKDFLIQNTAALLHYGGHHADALRRYLAQSVAAVRAALHAPAQPGPALTAWLDRIGASRGVADSLVALERLVADASTPQRTIEAADRVHRWRMEMTHGARDRS